MIKVENSENGMIIGFDGDAVDVIAEIMVLCAVFCENYSTGKEGFDTLKKAVIDSLDSVTYENARKLVGAAEKQKPIYKDGLYHCPNCGDKDLILVGDEACEKCGQVLDWSGIAEEEK